MGHYYIYDNLFLYLRYNIQSKVAKSSFPSPKVQNRILSGLCLFLIIPQIQYNHILLNIFSYACTSMQICNWKFARHFVCLYCYNKNKFSWWRSSVNPFVHINMLFVSYISYCVVVPMLENFAYYYFWDGKQKINISFCFYYLVLWEEWMEFYGIS